MKATATANANIALVKYWGKRSTDPILPQNGSISMTCNGMTTTTTVEFSDKYKEHTVIINDEEFKKDEKDIHGHIDRICKIAGINLKAKVISESNFPVAAGLASSASGFSALTMAAAKAAGLNVSSKELSIITRQGSGSACRSIFGGFVEWHKGEKQDGSDSYAEEIVDKNYWPDFRMITTIVEVKKKPVSSRGGMAQTVANCPYYEGWLKTVESDLDAVRTGIKQKDFLKVAETAEYSALKMHATMIATKPPIMYWIPASMEIIHSVRQMREDGIHAYFTMDAGPNVKVMCLTKDEKEVSKRLNELDGVVRTILCTPGDGAKLVDKHLF
ncbi:MAG: diphosphomevalonate decarboxylase [Candidatus Aenigmarchaeota archaeon]|nr:diphosphomevalonate decarboxylase [Candidatus Aenigmarchaeota archaeon]